MKEQEIKAEIKKHINDDYFVSLAYYDYLTLNDIMLIYYATKNNIVNEKEVIEILNKSTDVEPIKQYVQHMYTLKNTNLF